MDRAAAIVMGDMPGTGVIGFDQVVRKTQDLNGSRSLSGICEQAGGCSGSIDTADPVLKVRA